MKRTKYLPQGVATAISILIIAVILLAPTALAIEISILDISEGETVQQGGTLLSFRVQIDIATSERVPLQNLNIILDGTTYQFTPSGGNVTVQTLMSVSAPSNLIYDVAHGYAYGNLGAYGFSFLSGYGFGNGTGYGFAGPTQFVYDAILDQNQLSTGNHTIRAELVTGMAPISAFSSASTSFTVSPASGVAQTVSSTVSGATSTVDDTATTGVKVALESVTYLDGTNGTIVTQKFSATPSTAITVSAATGKTPVKYVDVKAYNLAGGTATITVTYTDAQIQALGLDESTLTLFYYDSSSTSWIQLSSIVRNTVANTLTGTISVTKLSGTIISLTGSTATPPAPPVLPPIVLSKVTANMRALGLTLAPGSSTTITLTLNSQTNIVTGFVNFNLPDNLEISNIKTLNFEGSSSITDGVLRIDKTTSPYMNVATISFTVTVPLNSSVQVGGTYSVTIEEVVISGSTVSFNTPRTITLIIQKPSVSNIFSVLDSYFDNTASVYTENRVPTTQDILYLLDFHFTGKVEP